MRGSGRAAALLLALLAALGILLARGRLRELALRLRLAFLAIVTVLSASILVRGVLAGGDSAPWALVAFALVAPCVALAWRDFLRPR